MINRWPHLQDQPTRYLNKTRNVVLPEDNVGILPTDAAAVDRTVDVLTTAGVEATEWLQTTTDGVATGWYV